MKDLKKFNTITADICKNFEETRTSENENDHLTIIGEVCPNTGKDTVTIITNESESQSFGIIQRTVDDFPAQAVDDIVILSIHRLPELLDALTSILAQTETHTVH